MANAYNVYFGLPGNLIQISEEQAGLSVVVPYNLDYNTVYNWRVDTVTDTETIVGDTWSFTVQALSYPLYSTHPISGLPTGESNQITVRRLVAIANNKFWYEDI